MTEGKATKKNDKSDKVVTKKKAAPKQKIELAKVSAADIERLVAKIKEV